MKIAFLTTDSREHFRDYSNPTPYFGTAPQALLSGFEDIEGIEIHVISCVRSPVASPASIGRNIFYHSLLVPKWGWLRTGYRGCIRAVRTLLDQLHPDLVHGQGTERDCALSAVRSGRPNVLTIHGNMRRIARVNHAKPFSPLWIAARIEKLCLRKTDGVVCITEHTKREVSGLAQRTWIIPNAVDSAFFNIPRNPANPPVLVCPATISLLKNQLRLIAALAPLHRQRAIRLVFAGLVDDSTYSNEFRRVLSTHPWCEHKGFLDRAALRELLSMATALVLPSLEENCPMAILEAMAAGVPVIAARVGGIPELIEHQKTGLLFDPLSEPAIYGAVERLLESPAEAEVIAEAATEKAKRDFHPRQVARKHFAIYEEVLSGVRRTVS